MLIIHLMLFKFTETCQNVTLNVLLKSYMNYFNSQNFDLTLFKVILQENHEDIDSYCFLLSLYLV